MINKQEETDFCNLPRSKYIQKVFYDDQAITRFLLPNPLIQNIIFIKKISGYKSKNVGDSFAAMELVNWQSCGKV